MCFLSTTFPNAPAHPPPPPILFDQSLKWHNLSGKIKKGLFCLCFFCQNPSVALLSTKSNNYDKLNLYHFLFSSQFKQ